MLPTTEAIQKQLIRLKFTLEINISGHVGKDTEPDNTIAIILLDYCVEGLLKTLITASTESLPGKGDPKFHELWAFVDDKIVKNPSKGITLGALPFKIDLSNLHNLRNSSQHKSQVPHHADVERYTAITKDFFDKVFEGLFGLSYTDLTLVSLVKNDRIRTLLSDGKTLHGAGKWMESIAKSAEAVERMVRMAGQFYSSRHSRDLYKHERLKDRAVGEAIKEVAEALKEARRDIARQMQFLVGLDHRGYRRYKELAPNVMFVLSGDAHKTFWKSDYSEEESEFVWDYALQNVLRMEGYGIEEKDGIPK